MNDRIASILVRRGVQAVLVAVFIGIVSFFLMRALPGDTAYRVAAYRYGYDMVTAAAAEAVRAELKLDQPALTALWGWMRDLSTLNFGTSLVSSEPVIDELGHHLNYTLQLALAALVVSAGIGVPLGLAAGWRPHGWVDRITLGVSVVLRTTPTFLVGMLLVLLFSVRLGALPAAGDANGATLLLPALTLGLGLAAVSSRVARDAIVAVRESAYYRFARIKGLGPWRTLIRHGLRNIGVPLVAYLGVQAVFLVEGVVVVESLFAWPGLGHALLHALFGRDVPVIQGAVLLLALMFVLFNTVVDLASLAIDPRRRGRST